MIKNLKKYSNKKQKVDIITNIFFCLLKRTYNIEQVMIKCFGINA